MKKLAILLLAFALLATSAMAEMTYNQYDVVYNDVEFSERLGVYSLNPHKELFEVGGDIFLMSPTGEVLNREPLTMLQFDYRQPIAVVSYSDDFNGVGFVDGQGNPMMPAQYGSAGIIDAHWQYGVVCEETSEAEYDFEAKDGKHYNYGRVDFWQDGEFVGALAPEYLYLMYHMNAYGDFLYFQSDEQGGVGGKGGGYAFSKKYGLLSYDENSDFNAYHEYNTRTGFHYGSNQTAFTPECTLTADEVLEGWTYDKKTCDFLDLQGNVVGHLDVNGEPLYTTMQLGDYIHVATIKGVEGLLDQDFNVIFPVEYDFISHNGSDRSHEYFFDHGYQLVQKDGVLMYVDRDLNVLTTIPWELESYKDIINYQANPLFACVEMDGKTHVTTPYATDLVYDKVYNPRFGHYFLEVEVDGQIGCVNMLGEFVVPLGKTGSYNFSDDGLTVERINNDDVSGKRLYEIFHFTDDTLSGVDTSAAQLPTAPGVVALETMSVSTETPTAVPTEAPTATPAEAPAPAVPAADDGAWSCPNCGAANSGNFCTNCGAKRPEPALTQCPTCGWQIPEGTQPRFCQNCGTKLAED